MKKRVFSMILVLLILISLSISAVADDGFDVEQQESSDTLKEMANNSNQDLDEAVLPDENETIVEDGDVVVLEPASEDGAISEEEKEDLVLEKENSISDVDALSNEMDGEGYFEIAYDSDSPAYLEYENGEGYLYKDGVFQNFNGMAPIGSGDYSGEWLLFENGIFQIDYSGSVDFDDGETRYFVNGVFQKDFTGSVDFDDGEQRYFENGVFQKDFTGSVEFLSGETRIFKNGVFQKNFTGKALLGYDAETMILWRIEYYAFGVFQKNFTGKVVLDSGEELDVDNGIVKNIYDDLVLFQLDGNWKYFVDGQFQEYYSGLVEYNGALFYIEDGTLRADLNGLVLIGDTWYFIAGGQVQTQHTGLAQYDGEWFYIENGVLNVSKNGLVFYDGGQFLVSDGRIRYDVSGLWLNSSDIGGDNRWYYLANGQVQTQYSGVAMYDGAFFVVEKGVLNDSYNGTINYDGKEFYVENGQLTGEVVSEFELNWADFESILIENEIDGNFYTLNAVTAQFWAPSIFEQVELTDEDADNGLICYFHDGNEDTYGFFVTYVDGKGATLEKLAGEIGKDKAYTDLEKLKINGLDAIAYSEVDDELKVTFQHVSFLTDDGYFMTFSYWDTADEDYMSLVVCMVASIQPE